MNSRRFTPLAFALFSALGGCSGGGGGGTVVMAPSPEPAPVPPILFTFVDMSAYASLNSSAIQAALYSRATPMNQEGLTIYTAPLTSKYFFDSATQQAYQINGIPGASPGGDYVFVSNNVSGALTSIAVVKGFGINVSNTVAAWFGTPSSPALSGNPANIVPLDGSYSGHTAGRELNDGAIWDPQGNKWDATAPFVTAIVPPSVSASLNFYAKTSVSAAFAFGDYILGAGSCEYGITGSSQTKLVCAMAVKQDLSQTVLFEELPLPPSIGADGFSVTTSWVHSSTTSYVLGSGLGAGGKTFPCVIALNGMGSGPSLILKDPQGADLADGSVLSVMEKDADEFFVFTQQSHSGGTPSVFVHAVRDLGTNLEETTAAYDLADTVENLPANFGRFFYLARHATITTSDGISKLPAILLLDAGGADLRKPGFLQPK